MLIALRTSPAHAFAPEAAAALAARTVIALPVAARWSPTQDVSAALDQRLAEESLDPERFVPLHRFVASGAPVVDASAPITSDAAAAVLGVAPAELADAAVALRTAFATRDASAATVAMARVATACADLADPFQVTSLDADEVPGARAQFSDLLDAGALEGLAAAALQVTDPISAGITLAQESAALRPAIESAVRTHDVVTLDALRHARLDAALALSGGVARAAWEAAGAPALMSDAVGVARFAPNPVRVSTVLSFALPATGVARVEMFDLAGRRVWTRELGTLGAGFHAVTLEGGELHALPAGVYVARLSSGRLQATARMTRVGN